MRGNATFVIDDPHAKRSKASLGRYGCYVFARKWNESYTPWYIGKSQRPLNKELFTPHKLGKLEVLLRYYERGKLFVFLIVPVGSRGPRAKKIVDAIETYYIHQAYKINPDLLNLKKLPRHAWDIEGVTKARGPGRPKGDDGAEMFRDMMCE